MSGPIRVPIRIQGRDAALEAYIVSTPHGRACIPEHLIATTRPSHQTAHEWIAARHQPLLAAIEALATNRPPAKPYDLLTLLPPSSG